MSAVVDRPLGRLQVLAAGLALGLVGSSAFLAPRGAAAATFHDYSVSYDQGHTASGYTGIDLSRYDITGIYSAWADPGNCQNTLPAMGAYPLYQSMWASLNQAGNNFVEFGTGHCIDSAGADHQLWYAYIADGNGARFTNWAANTPGQAHRFYLQQDYQSSYWRWWVDNTQIFGNASTYGYGVSPYVDAGLESYNGGAVVNYSTDWGLQSDINGGSVATWAETSENVNRPTMYGARESADVFDQAENQSSSSMSGCAAADALNLTTSLEGGGPNPPRPC